LLPLPLVFKTFFVKIHPIKHHFLSNCKAVLVFWSLFCFLMTLYPIETGNFKLDGGAMFGVDD